MSKLVPKEVAEPMFVNKYNAPDSKRAALLRKLRGPARNAKIPSERKRILLLAFVFPTPLLFAACQPASEANPSEESGWRYNAYEDRMRGTVTERSATLAAEGLEGYQKKIVINRTSEGELALRIHPQDEYALPQNCSTDGSISIRIDDGPVESTPCDDRALALKLDEALIKRIARADSVWIETFSGPITEQSEFRPQGLELKRLDF